MAERSSGMAYTLHKTYWGMLIVGGLYQHSPHRARYRKQTRPASVDGRPELRHPSNEPQLKRLKNYLKSLFTGTSALRQAQSLHRTWSGGERFRGYDRKTLGVGRAIALEPSPPSLRRKARPVAERGRSPEVANWPISHRNRCIGALDSRPRFREGEVLSQE